MPRISDKRIGEYLQTAFKIIIEQGGSYPIRQIQKQMEQILVFDDYEKQVFEKSGYIRWQAIMHLFSINAKKAGWLRKQKGTWYVTDEGRQALELEPEKFIEIANIKYREWAESRDIITEKDETESPQNSIIVSYEQAQAEAREELKNYINAIDPYEFQELVAALFRGMGYYTPFVAPRGPDGGIDIVAYKDPIGAESPRIKIQVKHRQNTKVSRQEIASFKGDMQGEGCVGVIVSTGGFTEDSIAEIRRADKHIEKVDLERFIDLWEEYYNKLSDEDKQLLPLRKISFLAPEE